MTGTAESQRTPPQRRFEDYVLTRVVDPGVGLTSINPRQFTQVSAMGNVNNDAAPTIVELGFSFQLDGLTYKRIAINENGWAALVDPATGTFLPAEVINGIGTTILNHFILATFTSHAVLLAPWFDNMSNVSGQFSDLLSSPYNYSTTKVGRYQAGLEGPPTNVNYNSFGVSYFRDDRSRKGRRFIVRWATMLNPTIARPIIVRFELVLYENGTIEFRYAPRPTVDSRTGADSSSATTGIFMPNGTNRFRDFSSGLGYKDQRAENVHGGFVYDSTFSDSGLPGIGQSDGNTTVYVHNLWISRNWPGGDSAGSVTTFSPPVNRRKVLPRRVLGQRDSALALPLVARTGDSRQGSLSSRFDDRRSPTYLSGTSASPVIVNYPSTLPRFFGGNAPGTLERQNLFSGDFLVTGSVVKSVSDQYLNEQPERLTAAFNESFQRDQSSGALTDEFFTTGSSQTLTTSGFDQGLRSKTQIRLSFPVDYNVQLPGTTSSIYYYNPQAHAWEVPANSTYILQSTSSLPPSGSSPRAAGGDWADPRFDTTRGRITEDARGFGPIGNVVSSGSRTPGFGEQTNVSIGSGYSGSLITNVLNKTYPKSVRNNEEYRPADYEYFTLPITSPFLIEKAVFEVPIAAGSGWFSDTTQCFLPVSGTVNSFDFAGPGVTVALFRHVQLSKNTASGSSVTRRDLIMTGTIIPSTDNYHSVSLAQYQPLDATYQVRPTGFLSYAGPAGGVVTPLANSTFTGSVTVKAASLSSVGTVVKFVSVFISGSAPANVAAIRSFLSQPTLTLKTNISQSVNVAWISPFGRGGTGFEQAGRSVLGNEYVTNQGMLDQTGKSAPNPLYLPGGVTTAQDQILLTGSAGTTFKAKVVAAVPMMTHFPEPYLVMPGDRLVLAVSKMRPAVFAGTASLPSFTSSLGSTAHDFQLITGTVNITLYGSQIQGASEFHDTLNQPLGSDSVHELIGAEPVVDQFDVAYGAELSGSSISRFTVERMVPYMYMRQAGGSEFSQSGDSNIMTSSIETQRYYDSFSLTDGTNSWSTQLRWSSSRRISELRKGSRNVNLVDPTEIYWDTRVPEPTSMLAIQSPGLILCAGSTPVVSAITNLVLITGREYDSYFDYSGATPQPSGSRGLGDWIMTFPFEPRWSSISQVFSDRIAGGRFKYKRSGDSGGPYGPSTIPYANMVFDYGPVAARKTNSDSAGSLSNAASSGVGMPEFVKFFYGFGDGRSTIDNCHVTHRALDVLGFVAGAELRGWRYGLQSGFTLKTFAVFRNGRYGQFRDMLEQRPDAKFFMDVTGSQGVAAGPVQVRFVGSDGKTTTPEFTMASNLSVEATSSLPYTDGVVRNREEPISSAKTNQSIVVI